MSGGHLISASDRDLLKRITIVLGLVLFFTAAFSRLERIYSHKFHATTGRAQWIWAQHRMSANEPLAFFAARDFELPEKRYFTRLKIAGDPEYTLYVNGREVAGRRAGQERELDQYDISDLVRTGRNRIVVAVRAPQGAGGLIASIDIAPETANWVVTDGAWKLYREWHPDLLARDVPGVPADAPVIIGAPPVGRWNYPDLVKHERAEAPKTVLAPHAEFSMIGRIPSIRTRQGIALAVAERARATAFDFGFTKGRVRLTADRPRGMSRLVRVRFANLREELDLVEWNLRPIVLAPGETVVTTPEAHSFRYVMVFGRGVRADVLRDQ